MEYSGTVTKYIDLEKIIAQGNWKFLHALPGIVVKLMAKIIRQNEINRILTKHADHEGADFLAKIIEEFNLKIEVEGDENFPKNGKCFFVANHPLGLADGLALTHTVAKHYGSLKTVANDAIMFIPHVRPLAAAVNVFGKSPKEYILALNEAFEQETPMVYFPSGEVSRPHNGKIQDPAWQKSFVTKAISSKRDVIPCYFYGNNSGLFYLVNRIRQMLGIKLNIELVLLPHEMFNKRNITIKVKIGKPIPWQTFDESASHKQWAQWVRARVYELENQV